MALFYIICVMRQSNMNMNSISEYLEKHIIFWKGYPVVRFKIENGKVLAKPIINSEGKYSWKFFGYVEDALKTIQEGIYERTAKH
ncbi:MAG TPA: hypothetical protein P5140_07630 [Methanofastidiosum sp.]|nr:hypothetical protein [Methanofastidiosum sp.]